MGQDACTIRGWEQNKGGLNEYCNTSMLACFFVLLAVLNMKLAINYALPDNRAMIKSIAVR